MPKYYKRLKFMKKILIQYLYIFIIAVVLLNITVTVSTSCEPIKEDTPSIECKDEDTKIESPCKQEEEKANINSISDALNQLGASGSLPK